MTRLCSMSRQNVKAILLYKTIGCILKESEGNFRQVFIDTGRQTAQTRIWRREGATIPWPFLSII